MVPSPLDSGSISVYMKVATGRGTTMTTREKRAHQRLLQKFLVRFEDAGEMRMAFTENISGQGLFLKTRYPPPPGGKLRLLIRTARGTRVEHGVVIWSRYNLAAPAALRVGSGAGIKFRSGCEEAVGG